MAICVVMAYIAAAISQIVDRIFRTKINAFFGGGRFEESLHAVVIGKVHFSVTSMQSYR